MEMKNHKLLSLSFLILALSSLGFTSCGEDRTYELEALTKHNEWLLSQMREHYLWGDTLTAEPAWKDYFAKPEEFFSRLCAKGRSDKWSYIEIDTLKVDRHPRGMFNHLKSYGFDFSILVDPSGATTKQYLRVLTVYAGSPAARAGLKRGDFILSFDGFKFSNNNIDKMQSGPSHKLTVANLAVSDDSTTFSYIDQRELSIDKSEYVEDRPFPVVCTIDAYGTKVGYLMCSRLTPCNPEDSTNAIAYQDLMDQAIAQLRAEKATELVLDLRLCNFGTLEMARRLASYIVHPSFRDHVFAKTFWNPRHADRNQTYTFQTDLPEGLNLRRVVIIQSSYTVGAAEWLIRGLQSAEFPTILVGGTTAGQNVLTHHMGYDYKINIYPAVAYVADVNDDYNYSSGIKPDVECDDQSAVYLYNYGDENEIYLREAIRQLHL